MNSDQAKGENAKGGLIKGTSICLCCLIIGFLLGVAVDAKYRPNHILLYVNTDSKVSLSPKPGDIISWATKNDPLGRNVKINYTAGLAPCKLDTSFPPPTCVYQPFDDGPDLYLFGCTLSSDPKTCFDPQYGPKCAGCGQLDSTSFAPLISEYYWNTLGWDLARLFNPVPKQPKAPQNLAEPAGIPPVTNTAVMAPTLGLTEVVAKCNGNTPAVYPGGGSDPITHIPARPLDTITWNAYNSYSITNLNVCNQASMPSSSGGNQSCTIKSDTPVGSSVAYALNMTCNNVASSTQEYIDVQSSPKTANTK